MVGKVFPFGGRVGGIGGRGNLLRDGEAFGVSWRGGAGERVGCFGEELDQVQDVGGARAARVGCHGEFGRLAVQAGDW